MKNRLLSILKWGSILVFFVPIFAFPFVMDNFIFPFIVPKIILVRSLIAMLLGAYVLLLFTSYQEFRPRLSWLHVAVGGYFLSLLISTFVGTDWYNSFWDNHERMLGFFTIAHYLVFYFILSSVFQKKEEWRTLSWAFLISGALVMLVGVVQKISPTVLLNNGSPRVVATLGNAIYVAGLGLFMTYLGYLVGLQETHKTKRWIAYAIALFGFSGIFMSGTRGTLLAFLVSMGVMLVLYFLFLKGHKKIRTTIGVILASGIVLLGILYAYRQTPFVSNIPALGRLLNTEISSDSADTRIMAWSIAYEAWQDRPVFGWGPNNYYYAFNQYYRPEFLLHGAGETWFDNAHNVVMNTLSTQGMVGVVFYISLFAVGGLLLIRSYRDGRISVHFMAGGVAFLVGHFIHNLFVFENPTSYIYFYFFLAYIVFLTQKIDPSEKKTKVRSVPTPITVGVCLITFLFILLTNINTARANMTALNAIQSIYRGQVELGIEQYKQAVELNSPHITDIRSDFMRTSNQVIGKLLAEQGNSPFIPKLFSFAFEEGKKNLDSRPLDIRNHLSIAQAILLSESIYGSQAEKLAEAEGYLEYARDISPKRQQVYYMLATIEASQGKIDEAVEHLEYSIELEPRVAEGYVRLAILHFQTGSRDKSFDVIDLARERNVELSRQQEAIFAEIEASEQ